MVERRQYKKEIDGLTKIERYRLKDLSAYRKKKRDWARTEEQRKKRTEYMRIWREKNRDRHNKLAMESHRRNAHKHKDKYRERHLKSKFNLTQKGYEELLQSQGGVCKICGEFKLAKGRKYMQIDHCHKTGKVRGILCNRCNSQLGWYEKRQKQVKDYLK